MSNETLKKAAALIENPDAWTQGVVARDADNAPTQPDSTDACRWCLIGAVVKAADGNIPALRAAVTCLHSAMKQKTALKRARIGNFNDSHTHAEVLELLREAAE
jgi:hypothetical protein